MMNANERRWKLERIADKLGELAGELETLDFDCEDTLIGRTYDDVYGAMVALQLRLAEELESRKSKGI